MRPNLNAFAGRFELSVKSECLIRMVLLSEWQLRRALNECAGHSHAERHHPERGSALIERAPEAAAKRPGPVGRCERLGALRESCHREAA